MRCDGCMTEKENLTKVVCDIYNLYLCTPCNLKRIGLPDQGLSDDSLQRVVMPLGHDHQCWCGTATRAPHETGTEGCVRKMTEAPALQENGKYLVAGHEITHYSLFDQRLHYKHPCGCWSKAPESTNSIEA